jgi:hypothetical protein
MLLVCTLVGLAAMHSLGHAGAMQTAAMLTEGHHSAAMAAGDCAGDGCVQAAAAPHGGGEDMAGWDVCLAVVGGVVVAGLLAAALLAGAGRYDVATALFGWRRLGPRAPPAPLRVGLALATVSVLRI